MTTAIKRKISETMISAVRGIYETGAFPKGTRQSTINAVINYKLIGVGLPNDHGSEWGLDDAGYEVLGINREDDALIQEHDSIEDALDHLQTEEWFRINQATQGLLESEAQADTFRTSLPQSVNEALGFGEVYNWENYRVWHGLTATEIRDDMDTAKHVSRKDRRESARVINKLAKRGIVMRHG